MLALQERVTLALAGAGAGAGATPLPLNDSRVGEFVALLTKETLAAAAPEACGKKVTVKGVELPAARVVGNEIPLITNSELVLATDEIVTEDPVALSVPVKDALDPVLTLPKLNPAGASVN